MDTVCVIPQDARARRYSVKARVGTRAFFYLNAIAEWIASAQPPRARFEAILREVPCKRRHPSPLQPHVARSRRAGTPKRLGRSMATRGRCGLPSAEPAGGLLTPLGRAASRNLRCAVLWSYQARRCALSDVEGPASGAASSNAADSILAPSLTMASWSSRDASAACPHFPEDQPSALTTCWVALPERSTREATAFFTVCSPAPRAPGSRPSAWLHAPRSRRTA